MKSITLLTTTLLSLSSLTLADDPKKDAPVTFDNPKRATYQAILQPDKQVQGTITGVSNENGTGVNVNINFFSFPDKIGPFTYHIHEKPVDSTNNCNSTGGHLDPYNVTEKPECDAQKPATCQLGDLSGKHGKLSPSNDHASFQTQYLDLYISTLNTSEAFFGSRSIVVHAANGTRLNCGNFMLQDSAGSNGSNGGNASYTPTQPSATKTGADGKETGGAESLRVGMNVAFVVGVLGMVFLI